MMNNPFYTSANHGEFEYLELGDFALDGGGVIRDAKLAYATTGRLNAARDNAILIPHMYSGSSQHMRSIFVGPERAIDPEKYFVIFPNQFGNGLSSSPHNSDGAQYGPVFPEISIGDDVRAQHVLVREKLGIDRLELVLGWSMGAQQTYEWAVQYPKMVKRAAPIAGTARTTPHNLLFTRVAADAIRFDPAWSDGLYAEPHAVSAGLKRHAHVFALLGASAQLYKEEGWRDIGFASLEDFMSGFWEKWFQPMDPNNLLCMLSKWQRADIGSHAGGNLASALGRIVAKTYVIAFEEDMFMTVRDCEAEQRLIAGSELRVLPSLWGHFTPLVPLPANLDPINRTLRELLAVSVDETTSAIAA